MTFWRKVAITVAITLLGKVVVARAVAITKKNVANPTLATGIELVKFQMKD